MIDPVLSAALTAMCRVYQGLQEEDRQQEFARLLFGKIYNDFENGLSRDESLKRLSEHIEACRDRIAQDIVPRTRSNEFGIEIDEQARSENEQIVEEPYQRNRNRGPSF